MFPEFYVDSYINDHRSGDGIWIDMIFIQEGHRGKGHGTQLYKNWEKDLPKDIKYVIVFAADTGSGNSDKFWQSLGFQYKYDAENSDVLDYQSQHTLVKGVNGFPTPKSIWVNPEDYE